MWLSYIFILKFFETISKLVKVTGTLQIPLPFLNHLRISGWRDAKSLSKTFLCRFLTNNHTTIQTQRWWIGVGVSLPSITETIQISSIILVNSMKRNFQRSLLDIVQVYTCASICHSSLIPSATVASVSLTFMSFTHGDIKSQLLHIMPFT